MSWGYRVIIILVVFVAGIVSMVYISMRQTNEVIDANYYEQEMKYQSVIDAKNNLHTLADTVAIQTAEGYVQIHFPEAATTRLDSGNIQFMRLSDSKSDKHIQMKEESGSLYKIPAASFAKGLYKVRINWSNDGTSYYHEQEYNID
ncbi:MAG TPA: FixH family protein [Niabella sp.]|nr:FixH family protein [Niabella sp.]